MAYKVASCAEKRGVSHFVPLFFGRSIFDYIHLKIKSEESFFITTVILGLYGILCVKTQWLPFCIDIALAVMPFFYFGYWLKNYDISKRNLRRSIVYFIIWIVIFFITFPDYNQKTYLDLGARRYSLFPIYYIGAIAGTMFILHVSYLCCKVKKLSLPVVYVGRNSLYLLCVHIMDGWWSSLYKVNGHQFQTAAKRTIVDLIIFAIVMLVISIINRVMKKVKSSS